MSAARTLFKEQRNFIILIPIEKSVNVNRVSIERRENIDSKDPNILHIGAGNHSDLVIFKNAQSQRSSSDDEDFMSHFQVQINDKKKEKRQLERRTLKFWLENDDQFTEAHSFMDSILREDRFPSDYFSFIKRLMELLREFSAIRRIQLEIRTLENKTEIESEHPVYKKNPQRQGDWIKEELLDLLERASPNPMSIADLAKFVECDEETIFKYLTELQSKNLVQHLENDQQQWIRVIISLEEEKTHRIVNYKSISEFSNRFRPTIAIVTVNFFEKLAVDTMIENKITFVRHRTGESNVYTIGTIGRHHVVSTKLPLIGRTRTAQISTGSTATRLFGTFQYVQHVFIVGCAGGIAHYHNANKHLRRGDIVVAYPNEEDYVYGIYEAEPSSEGYEFVSTCYKPKSFEIYRCLDSIQEATSLPHSRDKYPWEEYLEGGTQQLMSYNIDCLPPMNDPLFLTTDEGEKVSVEHPKQSKRDHFKPKIHFGMVAGGKNILANDYFKQILNEKCQILCFDSEIDQVLAAIQGNRIESFMIIRAISDYHDGTTSKDWQPFSSLCAASLMKTVILQIPSSTDDDQETL